ncbi:porin [Paraburkholderia sp. RL17-347-BIC-D]|uniref:porin n=1 Tax=Paraburkholderia sp. RL17-347-BIC-D TaxID=3031632 RepID=UPI0038BC7AAB
MSVRTTVVAVTGMIVASQAFAQSSVTLFGVVDAALNYVSNAQTSRGRSGPVGHSQFAMQDGGVGGLQGSRWGLFGSENLGGGLSAIFKIENGFSLNNGTLSQGGAEFGRQAWVGLKSASFGTVTLGRQYDSIFSFVEPFDVAAQWAGYLGGHAGDVDNLINTRRLNNSIKYESPVYHGLTFGGVYSLGGVPGSIGRNQVYSFGATYSTGSLSVGAAYLNARNPNFSFYGTNPSAGTSLTSNNFGSPGSTTSAESNPIAAGYASASTEQIIAVGGNYFIGGFTIGATYSNVQFKGLGNTGASGPNPLGYSGTATFNDAEASLRYDFTPALLAGVAYNYTHNSGAAGFTGATYHQVTIGAVYSLSKRTALSAVVTYQHASGIDSLDQPAVAYVSGQSPSANNHQVVTSLSLRHAF